MIDSQNSITKIEPGFYSALVWILAGFALAVYGMMGLIETAVPGVEELVLLLSGVDGRYIYLAAFIAIFIEGLYFVGNFFPGSTLIIILGVLSSTAGLPIFIGTIVTIFIGWCLAGAVNIFFARLYRERIAQLPKDGLYQVRDRLWTTWFPAFRANYEVAQITEGGDPFQVFLSSLRVRFFASLAAAVHVFTLSWFVDIHEISNEDGFLSIAAVAAISFLVGGIKLRKYWAKDI